MTTAILCSFYFPHVLVWPEVGYLQPLGQKQLKLVFVNKVSLGVHQGLGFPGGASGKEPACQCRRHKRLEFDAWVRKLLWRKAWQPTPVFLPGESHGQRGACQPTVYRVAKGQA